MGLKNEKQFARSRWKTEGLGEQMHNSDRDPKELLIENNPYLYPLGPLE